MQNNSITTACVSILLTAMFAGCNDYRREGDVTHEAAANHHSLAMFVGDTEHLTASPTEFAYTWTSDNSEVATVDGNGTVTAKGQGTANIVARSGEISCTVPVTVIVRIPVVDFTLDVNELELTPEGIHRIALYPVPPEANDIKIVWNSDDPAVATVNSKNEIIGLKDGITNVHCTINGVTHSVNVYVATTLPVDARVTGLDPTMYFTFVDARDRTKPTFGRGTISFLDPAATTLVADPPKDMVALRFPKGDYIKVVKPIVGDLTAYTLMFDIRVPDNRANNYSLFSTAQDPANGTGVSLITPDGMIGGGWWFVNPGTISPNKWHRIVICFDGTNARVFVDGAWIIPNFALGEVLNRLPLKDDFLWLFADKDGNEGDIECAGFAMWTRALSLVQPGALGGL